MSAAAGVLRIPTYFGEQISALAVMYGKSSENERSVFGDGCRLVSGSCLVSLNHLCVMNLTPRMVGISSFQVNSTLQGLIRPVSMFIDLASRILLIFSSEDQTSCIMHHASTSTSEPVSRNIAPPLPLINQLSRQSDTEGTGEGPRRIRRIDQMR